MLPVPPLLFLINKNGEILKNQVGKYSENDPRNREQWTVGNVSRPYLHSNGREDGYCGFD